MRIALPALLAALAALGIAEPALASTGGGGLPWEAPLQQIQASLGGPVAAVVGFLGFVVAGGMLIFGGDLSEFTRRLLWVSLAAGTLLGANSIIGLFGATGAVI